MQKAFKIFENYRNLQTTTAGNENVSLLSKGTAAKPEKFTGKCRHCGKSGHKQAT